MSIADDMVTYTPQSHDIQNALTIILYILVGAVFFLASFIAYLYVFWFPPSPPEISVHEFPDKGFATIYSDPIPSFNLSEPVISITGTGGVNDTLGVNIEDDAIYPFGYVLTDGNTWRRFVLKSENKEEENWIVKNATYELPLSQDDFNVSEGQNATAYIVVYSCTRTAIGTWDCHGGWQIQTVNVEINADEGAQDECGGCAEDYKCIYGRCELMSVLGNKIKISGTETKALKISGNNYVMKVKSISGDGQEAKMIINSREFDITRSSNYVRTGNLRFFVDKIREFSPDEDGYLELIVLSDFETVNIPSTSHPVTHTSSGHSSHSVSSCHSKTCTSLGYACGTWSDGCGGTITCGTCPTGQTCTSAGICEESTCTPDDQCAAETCIGATCTDTCGNVYQGTLGYDCSGGRECGVSLSGCGTCGTCDTGYSCVDGHCVNTPCTPDPSCNLTTCIGSTCLDSCGNAYDGTLTPDCNGRECGDAPNGCGTCGTCGTGQTCNNGICEDICTPQTCADIGVQCGTWSDGCGGTITCGTCQYGTCDTGICICTPLTTNDCGSYECGSYDDGCGGTYTCGTCENPHGTTSCSSGQCSPVCDPGWGDCDSNRINGCETDFQTDNDHCGSCGHPCGTGYVCISGTCQSGCVPDCSGKECGDCGGTYTCGTCENPHGTTSCSSGQCSPVCDPGWGDCDSNRINGCETDLSTTDDCGTCGNSCPSSSYTCIADIPFCLPPPP